jgi:hypothetical protein
MNYALCIKNSALYIKNSALCIKQKWRAQAIADAEPFGFYVKLCSAFAYFAPPGLVLGCTVTVTVYLMFFSHLVW